jgi:hypothetical protein
VTLRTLLIPALVITVALYAGSYTFHSSGYLLILRWALFLSAVIGAISAGSSRLRWALLAFVAIQIFFNPFYVIRLQSRQQAAYARTVGITLLAVASARVLFARE